MNFEAFHALPRFRQIGNDRFVASCPTDAHKHGDRHPSLSGKLTESKILLKCQASCSVKEILSAMDLAWSDLFVNDKQPATAKSIRRQAAAEGFRQWRETELNWTGETLRLKDALKRSTEECLARGLITEEQADHALAMVFDGYSALEHRFHVLRTGTDAQALEVYRNG